MLFLHGDPLQYKIVGNDAEEAQAASAGYLRSANPPDPNYPKYFRELPASGRGSGLRRVTIRSEAEEQAFRDATEASFWDADPDHLYGGRPVGLGELIAEHHSKMHQLLDEAFQQDPTTEENAEAPVVNPDADTEPRSKE